ncbi:MAG: YlbF family regulator [Bacilli bacterium]|nr:YlbF family regulator [Bacilli bacterium]
MDKALEDVINCIKNSPEYLECIDLKKKMDNNTEITSLVKDIKLLQKKLLRTDSIEIQEELDNKINRLNEIPIYSIYNQKLNVINEKISYVNDELNDYFYNLLNEE